MDELEHFLKDAVTDLRNPKEARALAQELLGQWRANIVPSIGKMRLLRKMVDIEQVCGRLCEDGSCPWLRKHARMEGLRRPLPGEKAYCHRCAKGPIKHTFRECKGFLKRMV